MVIKYKDIIHEDAPISNNKRALFIIAFNIMNIAIFYTLYIFFGINVFSIICILTIIASAISSGFIVLGVNLQFLGLAVFFPNIFNTINYPLWVGSAFADNSIMSFFCFVWLSYAIILSFFEVKFIRKNNKYKEIINSCFKKRGDKYVISRSLGEYLLRLSPIKRDSGFFWPGVIGLIQKMSAISMFFILATAYVQMTQDSPLFPYSFTAAIFILGIMGRPIAVQLLASQFAIYDFFRMKRNEM